MLAFSRAGAAPAPSPADEQSILRNIAALSSPDKNERYSASHQLGQTSFYDPALRGHCAEAARAIVRMGPVSDETFAVEVLKKCGAAAIAPAREALASPDETVRRRGIIALAEQRGAAAAAEPELLSLFEKSQGHERMLLATTLVRVNPSGPAPVPALVEGLTKPLSPQEEYQRAWYIEPLAEMGPAAKPAVPALRKLLSSSEARISRLAGEALLKIDPDGQSTTVGARRGLRLAGWWLAYGLWLGLLCFILYILTGVYRNSGVNARLSVLPFLTIGSALMFTSLLNITGVERGYSFLKNLAGMPVMSAFLLVFFLPQLLAALALGQVLALLHTRAQGRDGVSLGHWAWGGICALLFAWFCLAIASGARVRM